MTPAKAYKPHVATNRERRPASQLDLVERRIRAAMLVAGIDNFTKLDERIGRVQNLKETTLRKLDSTKATKLQLGAIADACGVPYEFFTAPADALGLPEGEVDGRILAEIVQHRTRVEHAILAGATERQELVAAITQLDKAFRQNADAQQERTRQLEQRQENTDAQTSTLHARVAEAIALLRELLSARARPQGGQP